MNNIQKSFKSKGLRSGGKYADGFIGQAQNVLRGRHAQIEAAVNGSIQPASYTPPAPTAAAPSKSYDQLDADIAAARAKMNKPKNFLGFKDGKVPNLAGIGAVIPGRDPEQKDNVEVKVSAEEGIIPRRSMKELQVVLAEATGESIPQFIERTNGKPPAGLRAGGQYAGGYIDTEPSQYERNPMSKQGSLLQRGGSQGQGVYVPQGETQYVRPDVAAHNAEIGRQQVANREKYKDHQWVGGRDGEWQAPAGLRAAAPASAQPRRLEDPSTKTFGSRDAEDEYRVAYSQQQGTVGRDEAIHALDTVGGLFMPESGDAEAGVIGSAAKKVGSWGGGFLTKIGKKLDGLGAAKRTSSAADEAAQKAQGTGTFAKFEKPTYQRDGVTPGSGTPGASAGARQVESPFTHNPAGNMTEGVPKPGLFKQAIQKERAWVKENPWKARTVVPGVIGAGGVGVISAIAGDEPQKQAPGQDTQAAKEAAAQAQAASAEKQQRLQAARVQLGLSPHEGGDVYSPEDRAAITQAQGEWLGRNGISAEDQAQPAQGYQQASMNSRLTGGKNGLEAAKNYKLQYGPNSQIYGRSDRVDGKLNNFTGAGDGSTWESRNPQAHQEALQRAAKEKQSLTESIMARARSGGREDYDFAMRQAQGLGLEGAVQQASMEGEAWRRDPAGVYKQQLVSQGVASERALARRALAQDRADKLQLRKDEMAGAAQQRADVRGDKTYERRIQELKAKNTVNGELDTEGFNKDFEFMRRGLAESGNGLEDADNEVFDSQLDKARIANAPQTWDWFKSFTGMNDPAVNTAQDAVIDHYESSPLGRVAVLKNGATRRVSDIQGGGVGPWASPVDSSQVRRDKRDLRYGQGGS